MAFRNVLMLTVGLTMVVIGAIVLVLKIVGESSTTIGIVLSGMGIVFTAVSSTIKRK